MVRSKSGSSGQCSTTLLNLSVGREGPSSPGHGDLNLFDSDENPVTDWPRPPLLPSAPSHRWSTLNTRRGVTGPDLTSGPHVDGQDPEG